MPVPKSILIVPDDGLAPIDRNTKIFLLADCVAESSSTHVSPFPVMVGVSGAAPSDAREMSESKRSAFPDGATDAVVYEVASVTLDPLVRFVYTGAAGASYNSTATAISPSAALGVAPTV